MRVKLSDEQGDQIRHHFCKEAAREKRLERPPTPAWRTFDAVQWILHTGAHPNYRTMDRRFQALVRTGVLERVLEDLAGKATQRRVGVPAADDRSGALGPGRRRCWRVNSSRRCRRSGNCGVLGLPSNFYAW